MNNIIINQNSTNINIQEHYESFINHPKSGDIRFVIPLKLINYSFGLLGDLLRFVITLNNNKKIKILKINAPKEDLETFYSQEYAYPLISLLWNTAKFVDKNDNDIKDILRVKQNIFFTKINALERWKGTKYMLTSSDHLPNQKGLVKLFENSNGFNDDEELINNKISKILDDYVVNYTYSNKEEFQFIKNDVAGIVYELAKNTYEWGKTDANMVEIDASIRGVYLRFHSNNYNKLINIHAETPVELFLSHNEIRENLNESGNLYYLEILVFDSGVGFIEKFLQRDDIEDINIIKKCLIKNQTSSLSNMKSKKGIGLDRILKTLDKKGFIKISTDKYTLYRDLIKDEYKPISLANLNDLVLERWKNEDNQTRRSQGSFLSILYPFKKNIYTNHE
ncbi:hypothetical protein [Chryseobacterium terrae]|uniref:ATP-dependent DNA helicase recG C-terminal n=1 Tax=Chryseobacterium terrae TaxID=3163299 RepID=A0ABW8Y8B4_9FLAO